MERLTERNFRLGFDDSSKLPNYESIYERLRKYEDLEEQGKLLKLPCAVGDNLFHVGKEPKRIREFTVWDITIVKDNVIIRTEEEISFEAKRIGVDFFLTQEQAENALKEMKEREGENEI